MKENQQESTAIKQVAEAYAGVTIYKISQSKIIEYWAYLDMQHLLKQIS